MRISRASDSPLSSATSSRVELLPQSSAATGSATDLFDSKVRQFNRLGDEFADGVVGADEEVRQVRVQALDADPRTTDPPLRLDHIHAHRGFATAPGVLVVGALQTL